MKENLNITKRESKKMIFDLKNKMIKFMANASFYRLKFKIIDWLTKKIVGGWFLTLLAAGY